MGALEEQKHNFGFSSHHNKNICIAPRVFQCISDVPVNKNAVNKVCCMKSSDFLINSSTACVHFSDNMMILNLRCTVRDTPSLLPWKRVEPSRQKYSKV